MTITLGGRLRVLCRHSMRQVQRSETPDATSFLRALPILDRCVLTDDGCWEWRGTRDSDGYGMARSSPPRLLAHRAIFALAVGPFSEGLVLHHWCHNKACTNPAHIEAITRSHHARIHGLVGICAENAARETCLEGHAFDGHDGHQRTCSTCRREYMREYMRARRAKQRGAA